MKTFKEKLMEQTKTILEHRNSLLESIIEKKMEMTDEELREDITQYLLEENIMIMALEVLQDEQN